ncbi:Heterogeneous nuclear ribonucleoprotein [Morus notabilis]|uniref:Heterogeneous nuclear ribonucleoprotein n=1 Tax=Morus notabilis TaxID=981085 RepID=W9RZW7_9ROSA|nr:Heterogeneous nuclear ribonucleoprotein [Morus notabilis]
MAKKRKLQSSPSNEPAKKQHEQPKIFEKVEGKEEAETAINRTADDEPIEKLLEAFGKEQLVNLLREAAEKHCDVADRVRKIGNEDQALRKIFIRGLEWATTSETLRSVFEEYGEIEDCTVICDMVSGKSKGYGFILFKTRSGARKALKEPEKKIGNRTTFSQLSMGVVPAAASAQPQGPSSEETQRKIYVSNVGAELDPEKLTVFFSKYGEIERGPLGLDRVTRKPKGFCLFAYKTVDGARKALVEPVKDFEGHRLFCARSIDGPKLCKTHPSQHHHHNQRKETPVSVGDFFKPVVGGRGHLVAGPGGFNLAATPAQVLNPALG